MLKYFCDGCKKEIKGKVYPYEVPKYIAYNGKQPPPGEANKLENYDLCAVCYHDVSCASMDKLNEIRAQDKS